MTAFRLSFDATEARAAVLAHLGLEIPGVDEAREITAAIETAQQLTSALDNVEYFDTTEDSEQAAIQMADDIRALVTLVEEMNPLVRIAREAGTVTDGEDDAADETPKAAAHIDPQADS